MLYTFLLILLIIDSLVLLTVVLLQAGQGGGLAALGGGSGSTESFFGGRQAVTVLTKTSWWCGGLFLGLSLVLAGLSASSGTPRSVLEEGIQAPSVQQPLPLDLNDPPPADGSTESGAAPAAPAGESPDGQP